MHKINLQIPLNKLSYGIVGANIATELRKVANVRIIEIGGHQSELPHYDGDSIRIWHQNSLMAHVGRGQKIGFPIFELNKFSEEETHHLTYCDKVLVCSQWAADVVRPINPNVHVVPLGVDTNIFKPSFAQKDDVYRFYTVGKWEMRKSHKEIIDCFNSAFTPNDKVELHLFTHSPFPHTDNESWQRYAKAGRMASKIFCYGRFDTQEQMASIISKLDCGVFISKAEGWNLPLLEAMAMGHQTIATLYSGHTEFLDTRNSHWVVTEDLEQAIDGVWFDGRGEWAKIDNYQIQQTIHYMKQLSLSKNLNLAGIETAKAFSWENSVQKLLEAL